MIIKKIFRKLPHIPAEYRGSYLAHKETRSNEKSLVIELMLYLIVPPIFLYRLFLSFWLRETE